MSSLQKMLKQAQKMQEDMERAQNALSGMEFTFASNGVSATAKGDFTVTAISVSEELLKEPDKEMLEDLLLVAVNGALAKARETMETKLSSITGGLQLPGM